MGISGTEKERRGKKGKNISGKDTLEVKQASSEREVTKPWTRLAFLSICRDLF